MSAFIFTGFVTLLAMLAGAGLLHLLPKLSPRGRTISESLAEPPALDGLITYFTILPLALGPIAAGWAGLLGAVAGQVAAVFIWTRLHERAHREAVAGPRIVTTINRITGRWRNHMAVWITALAVPVFWIVRVAQLTVYPPLTWLVGLPKYDHAAWVSVSRHKFEGLVGHDLIWCLYCDWMTGVWSLGSEMLRNVESFWCPIRFSSEKKCENCRIDFPDVAERWTPPEAGMGEVILLIEEQHSGDHRGWFGHPARLTVNGEAVETATSAAE